MKHTKRYEHTSRKAVNRDVVTEEWPEIGFITYGAPADPKPSVKVTDGVITELDGKSREEFDSIDYFIADYGINKETCEKVMNMESAEIARMLVDVNVSRDSLIPLLTGATPAKLAEVVDMMNIVEIMMAQMKMRARRSTANQAHVTNHTDNPVLMAADAAEAALRGFAEIETTCVVGRNAPFNAIAILIGSQVGRPGVITQCSMEEAVELQLGIQGLTSYAETISVYGTEGVFTDGDDTPWSKAFLASAYASRGIKMRSSSGSGAELLMGDTEEKSLLYLEARCIWITKAAGIQGTQNGAIDGLALSSSVPGGLKMVAAENLIASFLGLEVAAGNDTWFTDSDMRRTAKFAVALFPGADFVTSGYSATPNEDNTFAGSNEDSNDFDDFCMIQRDYEVDGGIIPQTDEKVIAVRRRAAKAMQAVFRNFDFAPVTDEEVEAAVYAYTSKDMPERNVQNDIRCAEHVMSEGITGIDIACALRNSGFEKESDAVLELIKQRIAADYLQTSAIFNSDFNAISALNDKNEYSGPGTGYRLGKEKLEKINNLPGICSAEDFARDASGCDEGKDLVINVLGGAEAGTVYDEVVVCVSPSFGDSQKKTLSGTHHIDVLSEIKAGLEEEGIKARFVKCYESTDLGVIASIGSKLSGSGIGIGIQSKGTTVIHQKYLSPLANLELFSQAPQIDAEMYREIGKAAGQYARGKVPKPVPAAIDPEVRRYLVKSAILHNLDTECVVRQKQPDEFSYERCE